MPEPLSVRATHYQVERKSPIIGRTDVHRGIALDADGGSASAASNHDLTTMTLTVMSFRKCVVVLLAMSFSGPCRPNGFMRAARPQ